MDTKQASFTSYPDLASEVVGGSIIFATDDWFASAENLLKPEAAVFKDDLFTDFGKWMDGWESRRKRIAGHDWCIIQLGCPGKIHGIEISTLHFTGNYPIHCSVQGASLSERLEPRSGERMGTCASSQEIDEIECLKSQNWKELVSLTELRPGYPETHRSLFNVEEPEKVTHIRLNIFPDGGIARIRVYGEVQPNWSNVEENDQLDLVAMINGGICVDYTDAHYGQASNVIAPGRAKKMCEGWETARRQDRPPILTTDLLSSFGGEWARYKLGHTGYVQKVEIDTKHFKGNYPHTFILEGTYIVATAEMLDRAEWHEIVSKHPLGPHAQHFIEDKKVKDVGKINYVKLSIYPDGGISRMLLGGHIAKDE
ncbi:allantoicase-like [Watersipora subatra]|uniref:allantoicase-like n=1 Tax=Watersipora subatra TaxID=2589382 RepID=UPI00355B8D69